MKNTIIGVSLLVLFVGTTWATQPQIVPPNPCCQKKIDVVFVLDTTGSMGGLIAAAKEKIWAIANSLASAQPVPEIRMGLIGYRDRGDAYITKATALTSDLDSVYAELMQFNADGGGDGPESVNQALYEAVAQMDWTNDPNAYRVVFLVGDCPPHMDYEDDVKYQATCKLAAEAGITINTIQCGNQSTTVPIWTEIANRASGRYFLVEQTGGCTFIPTPYDQQLARLSGELGTTLVHYGTEMERSEMKLRDDVADKIEESAPAAAKAQRAAFNSTAAGERNLIGTQELVSEYEKGTIDLEKIEPERLPEKMRSMSPKQREEYIKQQLANRNRIQKEIKDLTAKRNDFLKKQMDEKQADNKDSFDKAVFACLKEQAGHRGLTLSDEQVH